MIDYSNSNAEAIISEYIHSDLDREIARRRIIDGHTIEQIAEEYERRF